MTHLFSNLSFYKICFSLVFLFECKKKEIKNNLPVCVLESKKVLVVSTVIVPIVPSVICAEESRRPRYLHENTKMFWLFWFYPNNEKAFSTKKRFRIMELTFRKRKMKKILLCGKLSFLNKASKLFLWKAIWKLFQWKGKLENICMQVFPGKRKKMLYKKAKTQNVPFQAFLHGKRKTIFFPLQSFFFC